MAATKEQERQALKQIRKIVEDLGEDSYIGMAFDGAWEIAEDNIENDFGNSCKWYVEQHQLGQEKLARASEELYAEIRRLERVVKDLEDELVKKDQKISNQATKLESLAKDLDAVHEEHGKTIAKESYAQVQLTEARNEIIKLKAKLFDLLYQGD